MIEKGILKRGIKKETALVDFSEDIDSDIDSNMEIINPYQLGYLIFKFQEKYQEHIDVENIPMESTVENSLDSIIEN